LTSTPEQRHVPILLPRSVAVSVAAAAQRAQLVTHRQWCVSVVTLHRTALLLLLLLLMLNRAVIDVITVSLSLSINQSSNRFNNNLAAREPDSKW